MAARNRSILSSLLVLGIAGAASLVACSATYSRGPDGAPPDPKPDAGFTNPGSLKCGATEAELYGDPGDISGLAAGAVIKCTDDGVLTAAEMLAELKAIASVTTPDTGEPFTNRYEGRDMKSDTHVFRVLYKTTRAGGAAGYAVATMYLPVKPVAEKLPLVLVARGSRGGAPLCAPSRHENTPIVTTDNKDGNYVHDDYLALVYPLAGEGLAVVATDNAGYSPYKFGEATNLPAGYAHLDDTARSYLDSARPLKAALGAASSDKLVLVGLSQGGHTVMGSLQVANTYATPGPIVGVAAYAPLWYTQRSWGITLNPLSIAVAGVVLNKSAGVPGAIWYHYTHAELMDGPGEGVKLFKPSMQAPIKAFVENICWSKTYAALGAALPAGAAGGASDFFSDEMNLALKDADLIFGRSCSGSGNLPLCEKWLARYKADHPVHTAKAQDVPILLAYGLKDDSIPPARFACVVEKLKQGRSAEQFSKIEYCVNPAAGHGGSVLLESDYVNDWVKAKGLGTAAPAANPKACPQTTWDAAKACDSLLPND